MHASNAGKVSVSLLRPIPVPTKKPAPCRRDQLMMTFLHGALVEQRWRHPAMVPCPICHDCHFTAACVGMNPYVYITIAIRSRDRNHGEMSRRFPLQTLTGCGERGLPPPYAGSLPLAPSLRVDSRTVYMYADSYLRAVRVAPPGAWEVT